VSSPSCGTKQTRLAPTRSGKEHNRAANQLLLVDQEGKQAWAVRVGVGMGKLGR
jgi:hypothetical protein